MSDSGPTSKSNGSNGLAESVWQSICDEEDEMRRTVQSRAQSVAEMAARANEKKDKKSNNNNKKKKKKEKSSDERKPQLQHMNQQQHGYHSSSQTALQKELLGGQQDKQKGEEETTSNLDWQQYYSSSSHSKSNTNSKQDAVAAARKAVQQGIIGSVVTNQDNENDKDDITSDDQRLNNDATNAALEEIGKKKGYLLRNVETMNDMLGVLQRLVPSLASEVASRRKRALETLNRVLFNGDDVSVAGQEDDPSAQFLQEALRQSTKEDSLTTETKKGAHPRGIIGATPDSDDEDDEAPEAPRGQEPGATNDGDEGQTPLSKSTLGVILLRILIKPLSKLLDDEAEKCRELALSMLIRLFPLARVADIDPNTSGLSGLPRLPPHCGAVTGCILPLLVSAVMERVPQNWAYDMEQNEFISNVEKHQEHRRGRVVAEDPSDVYKVVEPAEEIRLLICRLCSVILKHCKSLGAIRYLDPHLHDFILASHCFAIDPFPLLRIEGCQLVRELTLMVPYAIQHFCVGFIKSLAHHGCLTHRHAKVRLACLEAIRVLVRVPNPAKARSAGAEGIQELVGFREENVIPIAAFYGQDTRKNYFGTLCVDQNNVVRQKFFSVIADWSLKLPEQDLYEQEARLEPYILSALSDGFEDITKEAVELIDELGRRYEEQHRDELIDKLQYGVDGDPEVDYSKPLPPPFTAWGRPRLGSRLHVRKNVRRFLNPVLKELSEQGFGRNSIETERIKSSSAKLLTNILIFMEENVTEDMQKLLPALGGMLSECGSKWVEDSASGININEDSEHTSGFQEVALQGARAARLTGRFVAPSSYVDVLLSPLNSKTVEVPLWRDATDAESIGRASRLLALLCSEAPAPRILGHTKAISDVFTQDRLIELILSTKSSKDYGLEFLDHSHSQDANTEVFDKQSVDAGLAIPDSHVRAHVVSLVVGLSKSICGRLGSIPGAVYEAQGRIADSQSVLCKMVYVLLLIIDVEQSIHGGDRPAPHVSNFPSPVARRAARTLQLLGRADTLDKQAGDSALEPVDDGSELPQTGREVVSDRCEDILRILTSRLDGRLNFDVGDAILRVMRQTCTFAYEKRWIREWESLVKSLGTLLEELGAFYSQKHYAFFEALLCFLHDFIDSFCRTLSSGEETSINIDTAEAIFRRLLNIPKPKRNPVAFSSSSLFSIWCDCVDRLCDSCWKYFEGDNLTTVIRYVSSIVSIVISQEDSDLLQDSEAARRSSVKLLGRAVLVVAESLFSAPDKVEDESSLSATCLYGVKSLCRHCDDSRATVQYLALQSLTEISAVLFVNQPAGGSNHTELLHSLQQTLLEHCLQGLCDQGRFRDVESSEKEELHSMLYSIAQCCCSHSVDKALSMIQDIADTGYEDIQHLQSHCELLKSLGSNG